MSFNNYDTDVLIVGAGPTGLSLATALQHLKISFKLIEQKPTLSDTSKATNLMQGTQEQLAAYNLIEPMFHASGKMRRLMIHGYGVNLSPRSMRLPESTFQDILLYGQDRIEASLAKTLQLRGGEIEFETKLVDLQQDTDVVKAVLVKDENHQTIYAKYVVACDGPSSVTRTFTNCDFTPTKTGRAIRQVDAKLSWKRLKSMEQMWLFYFKDGFAVVVPLLSGYSRVLMIEPKENMPNRKPTLDELCNKLKEVTNDESIELTDPKWFSYTELSMGIAPGLRDGRVFLAGDAGNPILPNGGQGLNTAIQDSFNLGWKLAAVIKGEAKNRLLDTYEQERLTLRQDLEKVQFNSLKYTTETSAIMRFLVAKFGNFLLDKGGEYQMAKVFSQLNVHYRKSPLTVDILRGGAVKAGDRTANAEVIDANTMEEVRLFDLFAVPCWKLVCFNMNDDDIESIQEKMDTFKSRLNFKSIIITTSAKKHLDTSYLYYDVDEIAHKIYKIKQPLLLLIRPDQYVAVRFSKSNWSVLKQYIHQWFFNDET